jgi:DNA (cytosine-5)-methyltransferase 1
MRYLSVCSGVEAASVAWHDLGWTPVGFSEIEPFPSAVLVHRFPSVKNYGDMTKYKEWPIEPGTVDVLVGGTPCQSFSVAGLRKGLDDPRGNLMLVYLGLAERFRIPWLVWENVPGVLSSNGGRDFGTFLGALGELGYRWSFRVLDAQHFGVPQRRRRVFVVAHLGNGPHPASVLFEPESLRGDTAKGGKARKGAPRGAGKGAPSGGRPGPFWNGNDVAEALTRTSDDQRMPDKGRMQMVVQPVCATGYQTHALTVSDGATEDGTGRGTPIVPCVTGSVTHTLKAEGFDGSEDGTGRGTPIVPAIAFHPTQDPISSVEVTHALATGSKGGCATAAVATQMAVRRLLPVECERLQGFPDDWTNIPWRGKPAPDGPRYKAMGNSMAVPVMRWIGQRLDRVAKGDR